MNAAVTQSKPKLPGFINILLIIALGISLSKLMWLILTPEKKIDTKTELVSQTQNKTKQKVNYGKLIANQHVFGQIKKVIKKSEPKKIAVVKTKAPPVNLNLKLHGIVAYKSKDGYALISSNGGMQRVFEKGEELKKDSGIRVKEIYPNKVVLNNNGQIQDLLLPVKNLNKKSSSSKRSRRNSNSAEKRFDSRTSFGGRRPRPIPPSQVKSSPNIDLAGFRKEIIKDPRKFLDIAVTSPAMENGEFIGFRLRPGRNRKMFRDFGFKPNDIVTEVNGIVINSMGKGAQVLGELARASEVSVTVKRGGQILYLNRSF